MMMCVYIMAPPRHNTTATHQYRTVPYRTYIYLDKICMIILDCIKTRRLQKLLENEELQRSLRSKASPDGEKATIKG